MKITLITELNAEIEIVVEIKTNQVEITSNFGEGEKEHIQITHNLHQEKAAGREQQAEHERAMQQHHENIIGGIMDRSMRFSARTQQLQDYLRDVPCVEPKHEQKRGSSILDEFAEPLRPERSACPDPND